MLERKIKELNEIDLKEIKALIELIKREKFTDELSKIVYAYSLGKQGISLDCLLTVCNK